MANPINDMRLLAGVSPSTLRRWEREGILGFCPKRDAVGRRVFTDEQVELVRRLVEQRHAATPKTSKKRRWK